MVNRTDQLKYREHKRSAIARGIEFKLTFDQWMSVWLASGHYHERGRRKGQYVMARKNDCGPYSIKNVRITTVTENHCEYPAEARGRNSKGNKGFSGRRHTKETRKRMSKAQRSRAFAPDPHELNWRERDLDQCLLII
jgi:hypothetical protein